MATVTGLTAARMLEIEAESIVGAAMVGTHLVLTTHGGVDIDVGDVQGPQGAQGDPAVFPDRLNDGIELLFGTVGNGGLATGRLASKVPASFTDSSVHGNTLAGSNPTTVVVAGDLTLSANGKSPVGYYYVAKGVTNNPSVKIASAVFDGVNTTFVISFITGHNSGQAWEISMFPAGPGGRTRPTTGENVVYKPFTNQAVNVLQLDDDVMLYTPNNYTVYLVGRDGTGANGDHFRDFRAADVGVDSIEIGGTAGDTSPQGTEASNISGILLYHKANFKAFRGTNNPRDKSLDFDGTTGYLTLLAAAAAAGSQLVQSPRFRLIGTEWAAGAGPSTDRVGFWQVVPTSTVGGVDLQTGFEHNGTPTTILRDGAISSYMPYTDYALDLGGTSNRLHQVIAGDFGFRVWHAAAAANPVVEACYDAAKGPSIRMGPGGATAVDSFIRRGGAGYFSIPVLIKSGVPADTDFANSSAVDGIFAYNRSGAAGSRLYFRDGGVWTAIA